MIDKNLKIEEKKENEWVTFEEPKLISCKECKFRLYSASGNICTKFECHLDDVQGCGQGEKGSIVKNCSTCKHFARAYTMTEISWGEWDYIPRPYGECHAPCNAIYGENRCCNDHYSCAGWQMGEVE